MKNRYIILEFNINKKNLFKKIVTSYLVCLLLISSLAMFFITTFDNVKGKETLFPMLDGDSGSTDSTISDTGTKDTSSTDTSSTDTSSTDTSTSDTSSTDSTISDTGTKDTSSTDTSSSNITDTENNTIDDSEKVTEANEIDEDVESTFWKWIKNQSEDDSDYAPNERNVSADEIVAMAEEELGNVSAGEEKESDIGNSNEVSMCGIQFVSADSLKKVKVKVIKLKDKPEEIIDIPKDNITVHNYLDIKLTTDEEYVEEDQVESLKFSFKVEKSWITEHNIDKITVQLMRYHDDKWQTLNTTLQIEDETYVYYLAETPGCSTFAVIGNKVVEIKETSNSGFDIPWTVIFGFTVISAFALSILIFKGRIIYFDKSESEK